MRPFLTVSAITSLVLACASGCGNNDAGGEGGAGAATGSAGGGGAGGAGGATGGGGGAEESPADKLYRFLTGHFDSAAQSKADPAYFNINLQTCATSIPALGTRILHVEQAVAGQLGMPYRQRVYVVDPGTDPKTQAVSRVFEYKTPATFTGLCDGAGNAPTDADVEEKTGCRVEVTWMADHFEGATPGKECPSSLQGASYATSQVKIFDSRIESWDRGYDATDKQVWGATKGAYIFDRLSPLPGPGAP